MSSQDWKNAIRHNYVDLTEYLNVDEVLPRLYQQDVLTQNEYEEFKVITETRVKRADRLLQKLLSKTFTSYAKFIRVLQDTTAGTAHNELILALQNYGCAPTQPFYQSPTPNYSSPVLVSEAHKLQAAISGWCLHFVSSNYLAFEHNEKFVELSSDNKDYIEQHRWPPVSYLRAMEEYQEKYGGNEDVEGEELGTSGAVGRRRREKCSVM